MNKNVHNSTIQNNSNLKANQMPINGRMEKSTVVSAVCSNENEQIPTIHCIEVIGSQS